MLPCLAEGCVYRRFEGTYTASIHRCEEMKLAAQLPTLVWLTPTRLQCRNSKGGRTGEELKFQRRRKKFINKIETRFLIFDLIWS